MESIFSRILKGEVPASFVYRDDRVSAFMDVHPINPGHVLVVPHEPAVSLSELSEEAAAHLLVVGKKIATALRASGLKCEGVNLYLSDGEAAGQEVPHVHLHVIPRYTGDGFSLNFPPHYRTPPKRAELEAACEKIRSGFEG